MKHFVIILLILCSLRGYAQLSNTALSYKVVRVDSVYCELHLTFDLFRGWGMYLPNKPDKCPYSPIITFTRTKDCTPLGDMDAIEGIEDDTIECPLRKFRNSVTFVQVFKLGNSNRAMVDLSVDQYTIGREMIIGPQKAKFNVYLGDGDIDKSTLSYFHDSLKPKPCTRGVDLRKNPTMEIRCGVPEIVIKIDSPAKTRCPNVTNSEISTTRKAIGPRKNGERILICGVPFLDPNGCPRICTHYPKGIWRKSWWWVRHPFGRKYIKRHYI
jgi:hypothetical protein